MFSAFLLSFALLGADDPPAVAATAARPAIETYRDALARTGKNADAHVRLALWCEAHGQTAERLQHLSLAVLYDPTNALARGLMGLVAYRGKWDRPDVIGQQIQNDPAHRAIVKEYLDRRARTPDTAEAQMKLAAWCEVKGLKEQALAHYSAVTRIDPSREAAWKHLGYKKQGNRWVKPAEVAAAKQEAARQNQADKHWKSRLEKLRDGLESKDAGKRTRAEQGLIEVTDPRAVPMIWAIFVRGGQRQQLAAVQMLGQVDGPSASSGLAVLAVFSPSTEVRRRATETLRQRDPRDVVGRLIGLVHKPYKYQVRHTNGSGSPGELFVEGERFNIQRFYENESATALASIRRFYTPDVPFDPFSVQNLVLAMLGRQLAFASSFQLGNFVGPGGIKADLPVSIQPPISPQSAAQAGQSIAANPQNGAAIINQLVNNPANRTTPPLYWFMYMNQHPSGNPMHDAMKLAQLDKVATNPQNYNANAAFGQMLAAQAQAAQQDLAIARQLEGIRQSNQNLEQRLAMDVQFLDVTNAGIKQSNDGALPVLKAVTGQDFGVEPEKWKSWWIDQLGYAYSSSVPETKPTYTDFVYTPVPIRHSSCFATGTAVQTIDGPRPIQSIQIGDRVLSQGTSTGQLAFQPVVAIHHNSLAPTLKLGIGGESIVATGIHRFWKAGKGWTMARDLKAGDRLRMVGGTVEIESIEADKTQPVYNLEVAENRDFFVGSKGLLVHDFSFVQAVVEPFDRQPELGSLSTPVSK